MALARLVHQGQQMRQEAAADLGCAAKTRLDGVCTPGRVATEEMGVEIDKCAVRAGELGDDSVYAAVVLASQLGIDACEVEGVVAERRIINVTQERGPHWKIAQERVERCGEGGDTRPLIDE